MPLYLSKFSYTPENLGPADREPRGPPRGRSVVHRVGRREAPRVLVRVRHARRLQPMGGARQRVHGRGCAGDWRRRCAQLARNNGPSHRRRNDGRPAQGGASRVPSTRRVAAGSPRSRCYIRDGFCAVTRCAPRAQGHLVGRAIGLGCGLRGPQTARRSEYSQDA